MPSSRPYVIRAMYEWIVDNGCTPYLVVDASVRHVDVPQQYVKDGQIILNISPVAVMGLELESEAITFSGRFAGKHTAVYIPTGAVVGIYARENGQGMVFDPEDSSEPPSPPSDDGSSKHRKKETQGRPVLHLVK
ncbi:MAG: ClpXP protease specificity-enhancing factor [Gammaproteobacteria bacterium]|nr:MAG: ClpXP protease specificity-enhancing factor [Gammaproteobacteria bacterium]